MKLWPIQERALQMVPAAWERGVRRVALTAPTGTGKSVTMIELIRWAIAKGWYAVMYTNRKMLCEQLQGTLDDHGIGYGIRAAGYESSRDEPVQISSIGTERERTLNRKKWAIHGHGRPCLVLVDECHSMTSETAAAIMSQHQEQNHFVVGVTATPFGLEDLYDELLIAGNVTDGRNCGALVPARHYGPDEPDFRFETPVVAGKDIPQHLINKLMMREGLFGRVFENYEILNPQHKPAILFAPGVQESIYFAKEFTRRGVSAAHIDGDCVWVEGEFFDSSPEIRASVLEGSKDGSIRVLCNRFVLREGIDAPWLAHGILATVFGALQSYLQSGGRLLRRDVARGDLQQVVVQDHGGNWWRHGSLNEDREWELCYDNRIVAGLREDRLRDKTKREPFRCPGCAMIMGTKVCPGCGFAVGPRWKPSRPVVQSNGTLVELYGDVYKPRITRMLPDTAKLWKSMYYRALKSKTGMTFRAAESLFVHEHHHWPPRNLPLMPKGDLGWYRRVRDTPKEELL